MIVCSAAMPDQTEDYFKSHAAELHLQLKKAGLDTIILARTCLVSALMNLNEPSQIMKITSTSKKAPPKYQRVGSKATFMFDEKGKQIVEDAYFQKWKKMATEAILQCAKYASSTAQADHLNKLYFQIIDQSPEAVYEELMAVYGQKNSFIDHQGYFNLWKRQNIREIFNAMLEEGNKIYSEKYIKTCSRDIVL